MVVMDEAQGVASARGEVLHDVRAQKAGRAGDQNFALIGFDAGLLKRDDAQSGSVARGADRHCLTRGER